MKTWLKIFMFFILTALPLSFTLTASAEKLDISVSGQVYYFDDDGGYTLISGESMGSTDYNSTLGHLSVFGSASQYDLNGVPAFTVDEGAALSIAYSYAPDYEEGATLVSDYKSTVNGAELDGYVGKGAVMLETSSNGVNYSLYRAYRDVFGDNYTGTAFTTNEIQLYSGCWYRVTVAYRVKYESDSLDWKFFNWDIGTTRTYDYRKVCEVYTVYAAYGADCIMPESGEEYYFAGKEYTVNTGLDNGYSGNAPIGSSDVHSGFELGQFTLIGCTRGDDGVYYKGAYEKVRLGYILKQADLSALNGSSDLMLARSPGSCDIVFENAEQDMGQGALFIRKSDYDGTLADSICYNFLGSVAEYDEDVFLGLFDEGDYEVRLDYRILNTKGLDKEYDYRQSFTFKIRSSDIALAATENETGTVLADHSYTQKGFGVRSSGLMTVHRQTLPEGGDELSDDTAFTRPVQDGEEFTEEGLYRIAAVDKFNSALADERTVYIGEDRLMIAYVTHFKNGAYEYTVARLKALVENGAEILENGEIVLPPSSVEEASSAPAVSEEQTAVSPAPQQSLLKDLIPFMTAGVAVIATAITAMIVLTKRKSPKGLGDDREPPNQRV